MHCSIVTLFPTMFDSVLKEGVLGRAIREGLLTCDFWNPRDFAQDRAGRVDDRPYGGGPGMVMQYEPLAAAIAAAKQVSAASRVMGMSPQGRQITQGVIREWALGTPIIFVAGRYEGLDERLFTGQIIQEEWSIGDYVLTGGELAIMVILDAMSRWVPGVLGHAESVQRESFVDGLLDCPHYTRPARVAEQEVPEVLLRGDHEAIRCWRRKQQLGRTWVRRSELLNKVVLTEEDRGFLKEFLIEQGENKS